MVRISLLKLVDTELVKKRLARMEYRKYVSAVNSESENIICKDMGRKTGSEFYPGTDFNAVGAENTVCMKRDFALLFGSSSGPAVALLIARFIDFSVRQSLNWSVSRWVSRPVNIHSVIRLFVQSIGTVSQAVCR
jgi:hypothetical protein